MIHYATNVPASTNASPIDQCHLSHHFVFAVRYGDMLASVLQSEPVQLEVLLV